MLLLYKQKRTPKYNILTLKCDYVVLKISFSKDNRLLSTGTYHTELSASC
jgi:hypothetical protein